MLTPIKNKNRDRCYGFVISIVQKKTLSKNVFPVNTALSLHRLFCFSTMIAIPDYYSSTVSSETLSGSVSSRSSRVRTVRLVRPMHGTLPPPGLTCRHGPSLGFSIRGGREHGTGFFVSSVEVGSEAYRQGLKVSEKKQIIP